MSDYLSPYPPPRQDRNIMGSPRRKGINTLGGLAGSVTIMVGVVLVGIYELNPIFFVLPISVGLWIQRTIDAKWPWHKQLPRRRNTRQE